jgi:hypothetical protein
MLKVILIILNLLLGGRYTLMAIKEKSKFLWVCVGYFFLCAIMTLCFLLARC